MKIKVTIASVAAALQIIFSNPPVMMNRRNQILAVKRQILPVIHFAVCFSGVSQKSKYSLHRRFSNW